MKKVLVDGLGWSTTNTELAKLFAGYGEVAGAVVIRDQVTGESRGFGFVEMQAADAERAVAELNGTPFGSRELVVSLAKEQRSA